MASQTSNYDIPYPVLTDPPNVPADMQALAQAVDAQFTSANIAQIPVGDSSNSVTLTSADKRLAQSDQTVILANTITLSRRQWVWLEGKARIDNSGTAVGAVGVHIAIDGTSQQLGEAGPISINSSGTTRLQISTGSFSALLDAGDHLIEFRADRDSTGILDAIHSGSLSTGPTYNPTSLIIIV